MSINRSKRNNTGLLGRFNRAVRTSAKVTDVSGGSSSTSGGDTIKTYTGTTPVSVSINNNVFPSSAFISPTENNSFIGRSHNSSATVRVLVVGGGMSGSDGHSSGGHGGGAIDAVVPVSAGNHTITVGGGGSGNAGAANGTSSAFSQDIPPVSGPVGSSNNFYGFTNGQGRRSTGGTGNSPNTYHPDDGPVAGQPVPGPGSAQNRRGGPGLYTDITGSGQWFGGGGGAAGGNGYESSKGGHGGFGGGGGGGTGPGGPGGQFGNPNGTLGPSPGPDGAAGGVNSGGGGGSGGINNCGTVYCPGKSGGSGIVIIRYPS